MCTKKFNGGTRQLNNVNTKQFDLIEILYYYESRTIIFDKKTWIHLIYLGSTYILQTLVLYNVGTLLFSGFIQLRCFSCCQPEEVIRHSNVLGPSE